MSMSPDFSDAGFGSQKFELWIARIGTELKSLLLGLDFGFQGLRDLIPNSGFQMLDYSSQAAVVGSDLIDSAVLDLEFRVIDYESFKGLTRTFEQKAVGLIPQEEKEGRLELGFN